MSVYQFKICIVGDSLAGKSSIIKRFVFDTFADNYEMTIGSNIYKKNMRYNGNTVHLTIWDIIGNAGFRNILKTAYFYGADGLLAVGDITRPDTFESLPDWVSLAIEGAEKELPRILLANKSDLEWKMKEDDIATWAAKLFASSYFITSAKTGDNIYSAFRALVKLLIHQARR